MESPRNRRSRVDSGNWVQRPHTFFHVLPTPFVMLGRPGPLDFQNGHGCRTWRTWRVITDQISEQGIVTSPADRGMISQPLIDKSHDCLSLSMIWWTGLDPPTHRVRVGAPTHD